MDHPTPILTVRALAALARQAAEELAVDQPFFAIDLRRFAAKSERWVAAVEGRIKPAAPEVALSATEAVLGATSQLAAGATSRNIADHINAKHGLRISPGTVRAIRSRAQREQQLHP